MAGNRFHRLERPWLHEGAEALLGPQREAFVAGYKFAIEPATDDRPFFFDFFRWRALPVLLALRGQGAAALLDWGYPVLVATLLQAALLAMHVGFGGVLLLAVALYLAAPALLARW